MEHTKHCALRANRGEVRKSPPSQMDQHHAEELKLGTWQPPQACLQGGRSISWALLLQAMVLRGTQQWVFSHRLEPE